MNRFELLSTILFLLSVCHGWGLVSPFVPHLFRRTTPNVSPSLVVLLESVAAGDTDTQNDLTLQLSKESTAVPREEVREEQEFQLAFMADMDDEQLSVEENYMKMAIEVAQSV